MNTIFSNLKYFINRKNVTNEEWEHFYRTRWAHDKEVRSTHGVNCTGSCSWRIFVKKGIVTWEMQQTDYPSTRPGLPNHEPRGCPRGASYSWYLYNSGRVKHPMIRKELLDLWDAALAEHHDPVEAWASIMEDEQKRNSYKRVRGLGGFVRLDWQKALEIMFLLRPAALVATDLGRADRRAGERRLVQLLFPAALGQ